MVRGTTSPRVVALRPGSPGERAGLRVGDEIVAVGGRAPRDVIEYSLAVDEAEIDLSVRRDGRDVEVRVGKDPGEPLGAEVSSALFDRVRTCDNHCAFCFIHQLPPGMRRSLSLKDDDYRLSFLYGNFTTLTRFTEMDLERVVTERLSPLFVSIHATDPAIRSELLRNRRGATSLRWLAALLDEGIEVHGQIVVCPGVNDGEVLRDTLVGVLDRYPGLASVACVPLGVSRFSTEPEMRPHTVAEAAAVCDVVDEFQSVFLDSLGRRMVFAADEYYLAAGRPFPAAGTYEGFVQHENGIGMARAFEAAFAGDRNAALGVRPGFFSWVDGAPPEGYRTWRHDQAAGSGAGHGVTILTGQYGAAVLSPLVAGREDVDVLAVTNDYFGGNIAVAGLLTGTDVRRVLHGAPADRRYLLPDACLSEGRFLDDLTLADLPVPVEVVATDGWSLRQALDGPPALPTAVPAAPAVPAGAVPVRLGSTR